MHVPRTPIRDLTDSVGNPHLSIININVLSSRAIVRSGSSEEKKTMTYLQDFGGDTSW